MQKFLIITIPIVTIAVFILVMLSGDFLKRPLGKEDSIPQSIQLIIKDIELENWEEASNKTNQLSNTWQHIVKRVQFSSDVNEISAINVNIARLRGAIWAKNKSSSLEELSEANEHWNNLDK